MAYKVYKSRFPLRKLKQKKILKRRSLYRISQPRTAGRREKGISRRRIQKKAE